MIIHIANVKSESDMEDVMTALDSAIECCYSVDSVAVMQRINDSGSFYPDTIFGQTYCAVLQALDKEW